MEQEFSNHLYIQVGKCQNPVKNSGLNSVGKVVGRAFLGIMCSRGTSLLGVHVLCKAKKKKHLAY